MPTQMKEIEKESEKNISSIIEKNYLKIRHDCELPPLSTSRTPQLEYLSEQQLITTYQQTE